MAQDVKTSQRPSGAPASTAHTTNINNPVGGSWNPSQGVRDPLSPIKEHKDGDHMKAHPGSENGYGRNDKQPTASLTATRNEHELKELLMRRHRNGHS